MHSTRFVQPVLAKLVQLGLLQISCAQLLVPVLGCSDVILPRPRPLLMRRAPLPLSCTVHATYLLGVAI